jgi:DNA (cytosine-5)-methyltransferase 1
VAAFLNKHYGDPRRTSGGGVVIGSELEQPIGTITGRDHHSLAAVTLAKLRGTSDAHPGCADVDQPLPTITAGGYHVAQVRAFLTAYYGSDGTNGQELDDPMRTITTRARLGLVTVEGQDYQITDIGFRMLKPHELQRAQFGKYAEGYDLSAAETLEDQVALLGNSVPPELGEAVLRAQVQQDDVRRAA